MTDNRLYNGVKHNWLQGDFIKMVLLFAVGLLGALGGQGDAAVADDMIRLHIFANSDSAYDQQVKLIVRDAVLEYTADLLAGADSCEEIENAIESNLPRIAEAASSVAARYGFTARTEYGDFQFGERQYGNLMMEPGSYRALKIELGEGKGHNWFCVLYPEMGFRDSLGSLEKDSDPADDEDSGEIQVRLGSFFAEYFGSWLHK